MLPEIKIARIREVKLPNRGTSESAGLDFFIPKWDQSFDAAFDKKNPESDGWIEDETGVYYLPIHPQERVLIPAGVKYNLEKGYALIAFNKSGVGSKKGLDVLACVGDSDYQGEFHISVVNTGSDIISIEEGEKLVQCLVLPIELPMVIETPEDQLYCEATERGDGGFGSTGIQ